MRAYPCENARVLLEGHPKAPKAGELQRTDSSTAPNPEKAPGHLHLSKEHFEPCF